MSWVRINCLVKLTVAVLMVITVWVLIPKQPLRDYFTDIDTDEFFGGSEHTYNGVKFHRSQPDYIVPNVMHYAWYDESVRFHGQFRFHHMISLLSAYKYNNPEAMYFWYETLPKGPIWEDILKRIPVLKPTFRPAPTTIFGNRLRNAEHCSDVVRLEAVLRYGGISTDLDVVVLKSMTPLRRFETTVGREDDESDVSNGLIIGARQATFVKIWYQYYQSFDDKLPWHHSATLPGNLAKLYPDLVRVERILPRPNGKFMYKRGHVHDYSENYAIHLRYRRYNHEHDPEDIKYLDTTLGRIFRQIYYGLPRLFGPPRDNAKPPLMLD